MKLIMATMHQGIDNKHSLPLMQESYFQQFEHWAKQTNVLNPRQSKQMFCNKNQYHNKCCCYSNTHQNFDRYTNFFMQINIARSPNAVQCQITKIVMICCSQLSERRKIFDCLCQNTTRTIRLIPNAPSRMCCPKYQIDYIPQSQKHPMKYAIPDWFVCLIPATIS